MKKLTILVLAMLVTGVAWAQTPKGGQVNCEVKGMQKKVGSVQACLSMGGKIVPQMPAKKA